MTQHNAPQVSRVPKQDGNRAPLQDRQSSETYAGLQEIDQQPPTKITQHEDTKAVPLRESRQRDARKHESKQNHSGALVQLYRMAAHSIAQIQAPRKGGGNAVRVIGNARQKATNPSDRDTDGHRNGKQISRAARHAGAALNPFNRDGAAQDGPDDGLAAQ